MTKILVVLMAVLVTVSQALAFNPSSITFGIASTSIPSTPNLRIGIMQGQLAKDGNSPVQAMAIPVSIANYYLTKSQAYTIGANTLAIQIQVDQDTKMYVGSDLTNYILLKSGSEYTYTVK